MGRYEKSIRFKVGRAEIAFQSEYSNKRVQAQVSMTMEASWAKGCDMVDRLTEVFDALDQISCLVDEEL